jgi:hypothetical protein
VVPEVNYPCRVGYPPRLEGEEATCDCCKGIQENECCGSVTIHVDKNTGEVGVGFCVGHTQHGV